MVWWWQQRPLARRASVYRSKSDFSSIILDVMLPGVDGFEVLKRIRQRSNTPVLMLTTRGGRGTAYKDYKAERMTTCRNSFEPDELVARIRSILEKSVSHPGNGPPDRRGRYSRDERERSVTVGPSSVDFTGAEFQLLRLLMESPGKPLSRGNCAQVFGRIRHLSSIAASITWVATSARNWAIIPTAPSESEEFATWAMPTS